MNRLTSLALAALATAGLSGPAAAAPQILALLETVGATPLHCDGDVCSAQFTTYCMQEHSPPPSLLSRYRFNDGADIELTLTGANGSRQALTTAAPVAVETTLGFTAVVLKVRKSALPVGNVERVAIRVGRAVTLIPDGDDAADLSPREIRDFAGPVREFSRDLIDPAGPAAVAVHAMAALINGLSAEPEAPKGRLWQETVAVRFDGQSGTGLSRAKGMYQNCLALPEAMRAAALQGCLRQYHDFLVTGLNAEYWRAMGAGM